MDLWGETEGGKSVTLAVAASVWACPEENAYIKDYKGTDVGLEVICDLLNSEGDEHVHIAYGTIVNEIKEF